MKKFIVYLITCLVCIGVLAFAAVHTVTSIDLNGFMNDIEKAMQTKADTSTSTPDNSDQSGDQSGNQGGDQSGNQSGDQSDNTGNTETQKEDTKDVFETIYAEYSEKSHEIQEKAFKNITTKNIDISNQANRAYITFMDVYVEELYAEIGSARDGQVGESATEEELEKQQNFVENEAPAYDCFVNIMDGVVNKQEEYKPTTEEVYETVEAIIKSEVCKNTLEKVKEDEDVVAITQESILKVDEDVTQDIENALNEYYNSTEQSAEICENLANLFGIELNR